MPIIAVLLLSSLFTACDAGREVGADPSRAVVVAVVVAVLDGDTIDVRIAGRTERVRLLGIDTPEVAHDAFAGRPANDAECLGDEASAYTAQLLPVGIEVRLERDIVGRDDYGRLLAFVHRTSDGLFINEHLVRAGFATPLSIPPNESLRPVFTAAARAAEQDDVGIWKHC